MADTYGSLWRQVRLHCSLAPALLAQEWARTTWRQVMGAKAWSFRLATTGVRVGALSSGTFTIAVDATSGTAGTLAITSADEGRQIRVSGKPLYTVTNVVGSAVTLDRAWKEDALVAAAVDLLTGIIVLPTTLDEIRAFIDTTNGRRLEPYFTRLELDTRDPNREMVGDPIGLAPAPPLSPTAAPRYELWPYPSDARVYHVIYTTSLADPSDSTEIPGVLVQQRHIMLDGALARAARWPGTTTDRNPYFDLNLARELERSFREGLDEAMLDDEKIAPSWLEMTFSPVRGSSAADVTRLTPHPAYDDSW